MPDATSGMVAMAMTVIPTIAIFGSGHAVGKSVLAAGLGRILYQAGVVVAPFKAQSLAHARAPAQDRDGAWGEIAAEQALQARACHQSPRVEMNPVLLTPSPADATTSGPDSPLQVRLVTHGRVGSNHPWKTDLDHRATLMPEVLISHQRLGQVTGAEMILAEGDGSCVELDQLTGDLANLALSRALDCPWVLVCDFSRGGVFAQAVGVRACVTECDWKRCAGVIVNLVPGDPSDFAPGRAILEALTERTVFVVPAFAHLDLSASETTDPLDRLASHLEKSGLTAERIMAMFQRNAVACTT